MSGGPSGRCVQPPVGTRARSDDISAVTPRPRTLPESSGNRPGYATQHGGRAALCLRRMCHAVEAWSDGNPYYIDGGGAKLYAYHPDHDSLAQCIGNDDPHLYLSCGREFMVDSRALFNPHGT